MSETEEKGGERVLKGRDSVDSAAGGTEIRADDFVKDFTSYAKR